jgi:hypothetical protein
LNHELSCYKDGYIEAVGVKTWKMAECSESAGKILLPYFLANGSTYGPPAIKVSLLAKAISFPASIAATVGCNKKFNFPFKTSTPILSLSKLRIKINF